MKIGMGFILGGWKCSGIRPWWWLHNMMNILKTNEMYTLKWWIFMLYKLHLNFFEKKGGYNQCIWVPATRGALDTWAVRARQHHSARESLQLWRALGTLFPAFSMASSPCIHSRRMPPCCKSEEILLRSEYSASLRLLVVGSCTLNCLWIDNHYKEQAHFSQYFHKMNCVYFPGWVGGRRGCCSTKMNCFCSSGIVMIVLMFTWAFL